MQNVFHNVVSSWFHRKYGQPTPIQEEAWAEISKGNHVLMSAPTGSGKTLAAFLYVIDQLLTGKIQTGTTRVLYVSPLKALNNDIEKNLQTPLVELNRAFSDNNLDSPQIRVGTRSGDTPQNERRKMLRYPPEILITTPESLSILLTSKSGRTLFHDLEVVILDEVHSVFDNRRGALMMSSIERLVDYSGEFQRISLSATINPFKVVGEFVGGYSFDPTLEIYTAREVRIVRDTTPKDYNLSIFYPDQTGEDIWDPIVSHALQKVNQNRSTLFFTNGRRLAESFTKRLNDASGQTIAYAHHGSMSREIREEVETRLKQGLLKAIVATNTLEMGIDIGQLDEVMMIQSPNSVATGIQRIGRAGHGVGEVSNGTFLPTHPHDILDAAVLVDEIRAHKTEKMRAVKNSLDVLAQIIVSMVAHNPSSTNNLFNLIRRCFTYRTLQKTEFDRVLDMLAGRYEETRIRELKPRISIDRIDDIVRLRPGAEQVFYASGGVIPDRGYFKMRLGENGPVIGELDEEFVWENKKPGTRFTFGTQMWQVVKETHNDIIVSQVTDGKSAMPFWKGEGFNRSFEFSEAIGLFLERMDQEVDLADITTQLADDLSMNLAASETLVDLLKSQIDATGCNLPHRHHILIELVESGPGGSPGHQVILHNFWGNRINYPYGLAIKGAVEEQYNSDVEVYPHNNCIVIVLPEEFNPEDVIKLVSPEDVTRHLRNKLEPSGFFGARFRECAGRALLIERRRIKERMPLWMSRLRSQKLMAKIAQYNDFPILLEAWRTCLQDEFEIDKLESLLIEIQTGGIDWSVARTHKPSPFAETVSWRQINEYMYMGDAAKGGIASNLSDDLILELLLNPEQLPPLTPEIVETYQTKSQRLELGYSPSDGSELLEWIKDRLLIPKSEMQSLFDAISRDHGIDQKELTEELDNKLYNHSNGSISARETTPIIKKLQALGTDENQWEKASEMLGQWMQYYGPCSIDQISIGLSLAEDLVRSLIQDLIESNQLIGGHLVEGRGWQVCNRDNYEILLRILKRESRPKIETRSLKWLPLFISEIQGITTPRMDGYKSYEQLSGLPIDIQLLESDFLPARIKNYSPNLLDQDMRDTSLSWVGTSERKIILIREEDLDLIGLFDDEELISDVIPAEGKYDFSTLMRTYDASSKDLCEKLWNEAWRGKISNDSFECVRKGVLQNFELPDISPKGYPSRRAFRNRKTSVQISGNWYSIHKPMPIEDLVPQNELIRDRVRLLFGRYGILCRELLRNELPEFRWKEIFKNLRLMELSGEIFTGYFFEELSGPQFISSFGIRKLQTLEDNTKFYWMNAHDPASLCGVPLKNLGLPPRVKSTHLVFRGNSLILISKRLAKTLEFNIPPDYPDMQGIMDFFKFLLNRPINPQIGIKIETINDQPAYDSKYLVHFEQSFEVRRNGKEAHIFKRRF